MKKLRQAEVIFGSFVKKFAGKIPTNPKDFPDWYSMRMNECGSCMYNTANMDEDLLKDVPWYKKIPLFGPQCSGCGCYIKNKCFESMEACYLERFGDQKWNRMEIVTRDGDDFDFINNSWRDYNFDLNEEDNVIEYKLGEIDINDHKVINIVLHPKRSILITQVGSYLDTLPVRSEVNDYGIAISLNKQNIKPGEAFSFDVHVYYSLVDSDDEVEPITIRILGKYVKNINYGQQEEE